MKITEPGLYDIPAHQAHSATSTAAAAKIKPKAATLRTKVLAYLCQQRAEGATDEQIQLALGMNPSTQRPRRIELVRMKLVRDSGRQRATTSGRKAAVWEVV